MALSPSEFARVIDHPLDEQIRDSIIQAIHEESLMFVLCVTGGGVAAMTDLLLVPGASRSVLEAVVPYCEAALNDRVSRGHPSHQTDAPAVSTVTAEAMAAAALARAEALKPEPGTPVAGIACSAALVTDRDRRGLDRACIAIAVSGHTASAEIELTKASAQHAANMRVVQDRNVADRVIRAIAHAAGVAIDTP